MSEEKTEIGVVIARFQVPELCIGILNKYLH